MKFFFAVVASLGVMSAECGNLIYNGGFELGTDGFALHRIVTRKDRRHLPLELEKADPAHGNCSIRIPNPDGDYFEFYVSSFVLKPDTVYTFSMTAKTDVAGGVPVEALIHDIRWNINRKTFQVGDRYSRCSFRFKTGAAGGPNVIRIWSFERTEPKGGWKGNLWLDDISITEEGESSGAVYAGIAGRRYCRNIAEKEKAPFRLKLQNDTAQEYRGTLKVKTVSEYDGRTVQEESVPVALKAGEIAELPLRSRVASKYGSYTLEVSGDGIVSRNLPYVVIGSLERKSRDYDRDICVGINGGVKLTSGYTNHKLILRNGYFSSNTSVEERFALLRDAGIRLVRLWDSGRLPTDWATAEPERGNYDFTFLDSVTGLLEKYGMVPVHVLGGELFRQPYLKTGYARENPLPAWALPLAERPAEHPPYAMQKLKGYIALPPINCWNEYMTALARHLKGKQAYFEFTNEPNLYVTPEVYNRYLKATWEGLKAGDANARVVGFSVTSDFKADSNSWLEQAINAGGLAWCDILSFHPYSMRELGSLLPADTAIRTIFDLLKKAGRALPIWNTELYYLFDTPASGDRAQKEKKVEYLLTRFLLDCGENVAQSISIQEDMLWRDSGYLNYVGELIPSTYFVACNTLARLFEGAKVVAKHRFPAGVICYVYRRDGKLIAAVWNYEKKTGVTLDLSRFDVMDLFGNQVAPGLKNVGPAPWLLTQGKRSETEFLAACAALKPRFVFPVQVSDRGRVIQGNAVIGLHNHSDELRNCFVGLNGGGYSAKERVELSLQPGESRAVSIPVRRIGEAKKTAHVVIFDGSTYRVPLLLSESSALANGSTLQLRSADGRLAAEVRAEVREKRFQVSVEVCDLTDAGPNGTREPWESDSVELFLDPIPLVLAERSAQRYNAETSRVFLSPRDPKPFRIWSQQLREEDCRWEIAPTASGYSVRFECPAEGLPFGFGIKVNDAENSRSKAVRSVAWGAEGKAYADRFQFGIIQETPAATANPAVTSLLTDGSLEAGKMAMDWKKNYSSATYPATLVENRDFFNGIRCMKLTASPETLLSVISRDLPAMPGQKLKLSFWAKGEGIRVLDCCIEIWSPVKHRGEHLYIRRKFNLTDEWKPYELTLAVSDDAKRYPDVLDKTARIKFWLPKEKGAVYLDDISVQRLP